MLIVCPNCATSYRVEASSLGAVGRSVRCVRCRNVWFARDPGGLAAIARAHRRDVEALAAAVSTTAASGLPAESPHEAPAMAPEAAALQPFVEPASADMGLDAPVAETPMQFAAEEPFPQPQEPMAIADAPTLAPTEPGAPIPTEAVPAEDIETFAARRAPRRAGRRSALSFGSLPIAILALLALNAALIGWRAQVVRILPQTASLYAALGLPVNLRGLSFVNVTSGTETHDGMQVLVIEGTIASASARAVEVPRLRFSVRNRRGQEVYAWTALPARNVLAPGETLAFRSRLASPPPDARDVLVRFFHRRDLVAGMQ
jgi:predicted Zn finger-like uncharacterized protein